jgi:Ca2+-binding EF-hand superfamily protein
MELVSFHQEKFMFRMLTAAALLSLLSAPSMAQMMRGGGEGMFEKSDANNDGSVTREEFIAARDGQFAKFDRNSDGYIDSNDVPKRLAARRQQNGGGGDLLMGQFDGNGDGKVSKEEFINGPTTLFDRADADSNNVLDAKELAAAKQAASELRNRKRK